MTRNDILLKEIVRLLSKQNELLSRMVSTQDVDTPVDDDAPPESGKGSGLGVWVAYARKRGVEITKDDTRETIIAKCKLGDERMLLHQIWIGPKPVPEQWVDTWKRNHPSWAHKLWREDDINYRLPWDSWPKLRAIYDRYMALRHYHGAANVARVLILHERGGVYVDADMVSRTPLHGAEFLDWPFWVSQSPHEPTRPQNAAMGGVVGDQILHGYLRELEKVTRLEPSWIQTGAGLMKTVIERTCPIGDVLVPSPAWHPYQKNDVPNPASKNYAGPVYADHMFMSTHANSKRRLRNV